MKLTTRIFGEVEIEESKIINFPNGIIGFPDLKRFTLVHDEEEEEKNNTIKWLQSIDEPDFAMPVIDPLIVCPDYSPEVDKNILTDIGDIKDEDILGIMTAFTRKGKQFTVNDASYLRYSRRIMRNTPVRVFGKKILIKAKNVVKKVIRYHGK